MKKIPTNENLSILVVDDNQLIINELETKFFYLLKGHGYLPSVRGVCSYRGASEFLDQNHADILFIDYNFDTDINGNEMLLKLKEKLEFVYIVLISSRSAQELDNVIMPLRNQFPGRFRFMSKPIRDIDAIDSFYAAFEYLNNCGDRIVLEKINIKTTKRVFIIHGHDEIERFRLCDQIRALKMEPVVLIDMPDLGSHTIIEKFEQIANSCNYAVALFTPDDLVSKGAINTFQPRPNVLFELGWLCRHLGRGKIFLICKNGTNIPSDLHGIITLTFDHNISEIYLKLSESIRLIE